MIEVPTNEIIAKITSEKGLSEADVKEKIRAKLEQLAGLISEEGAAHIVASELGVQLVKAAGAPATVKELYPGMRSVTLDGRVTKKFDVRTFDKNGRQGKVASFLLGDETGQLRVTLWNDQTDLYAEFNEGDVVRVKNAYVKENRGWKELHLNTDSRLEVNPAGVTVGNVPERAGPARERKTIKELTGEEENVELLATIVQVYDPHFFDVCPECGKRVHESTEGVSCQQHGVVTPQTNYVLSAFLDDGTGNVRTTFWKNQTQRLTGKSDEELRAYQEAPASFETVKNDLLGEIVKVVGRCRKNDTFDRIELTANLVFTEVDPEAELARIKEETKESVDKVHAAQPVKEAMQATVGAADKEGATVVVEEEVREEEVDVEEEPVPTRNVVVKEKESATPATSSSATPAPTPATPTPESKAEFVSANEELSGQDVEEEVISLDDLEDLDEKL